MTARLEVLVLVVLGVVVARAVHDVDVDLAELVRQRDPRRNAEIRRGEEAVLLERRLREVARPEVFLVIDDDGVQHAESCECRRRRPRSASCKSYCRKAYLRRTNQPLYESVPPPCLMSVVTRYDTRSPSGPLNVRYARPMSNLFGFEPPFAAFAASSVCSWKSPNTHAEKSSPGVAGFRGGAGGGRRVRVVAASWRCRLRGRVGRRGLRARGERRSTERCDERARTKTKWHVSFEFLSGLVWGREKR